LERAVRSEDNRAVEDVFPRSFGEFLILKRLGSGAYGEVFLARPLDGERDLPTPLVVKRLRPELTSRGDFARRFQHEAALAAHVKSAHVARVFEAGFAEGAHYIAMEFLPGWTLSAVLARLRDEGRFPSIPATLQIMTGILSGLDALHTAALDSVHRDVAPKNVILGEDGIARLIDLGIGRSNLKDWETATGLVLGTPGYMAPEQVAGERVDQRADVYAAAVIAYELLTLSDFIPRGPLPVMLRMSAHPAAQRPSALRPDLTHAIDDVLERALAVRPDDRFSSARELLLALERAVPGGATPEAARSIADEMLLHELERAKTDVIELIGRSRLYRRPTIAASERGTDPKAPSTKARPTSDPGDRPRPYRPMMFASAAVGVALAVGIAIGVETGGDQPEIIPLTDDAHIEPPRTIQRPAPVQAEEIDPVPDIEDDDARPMPAPRRRFGRVRTIDRSVRDRAAPDTVDPTTRAKRLIDRAMAMRRRAARDPDTLEDVDALLGRLQLERASPDAQGIGERLDAIARDLDALSRAIGVMDSEAVMPR
jgi:serine/threonine protein kinase